MKRTTMLMILDGFGMRERVEGNAIKQAKKPNMDKLIRENPCVEGYASGLDVGLPDGQMGNSEVGHLNIGAGRIVYQELTRISKSIQDGDFFNEPELLAGIANAKQNDSALHLMGLLSDGGVHSHIEHLYGLLELAKRNDVKRVYVHVFLDGRDTAPTSGEGFIKELENKMKEIGVGEIATVSGRYYAMDRDNRWDRVEKAYDAMVMGVGNTANSAVECIETSYSKDIKDEFVEPTIITKNGEPTAKIVEGDTIIFFNFRPDRAREISRAFCDVDFKGFERKNGYFPNKFICFTEYDVTIANKAVVFKNEKLENTLGEYISKLGKTQLRIAETEKYAHVTFFFNGGVEQPYKGEDRVLIASPQVATYDLQPEMSAREVTDALIEKVESNKYDLIIVNYANPDMVGHTGVMEAAIKAIETVDECVGRVCEAMAKVDGTIFICADHGNADKLIDEMTHEPFTAHTTNPVPFLLVNGKGVKCLRENGKLCDIAPTLLELMELPVPPEMTGTSLLLK